MFDSQFANFYAVLTVIGIVTTLWVIISKWREPVIAGEHSLSESQENLTGISAFLLAGSSVALSIGFAISLSFHPILTIVFVTMFAGFALIEFNSAFHLARAWRQRNVGGVFFSAFMMAGGVAISILAGQSLLQIAEANAKAERLKQNAEYEAFMTRREYANQRVEELAITDSEVQTATLALTKLEPERERLQTKLDSCPQYYYKKCIDPTTAKLDAVDAKIAAQAATVQQGHDYQAARQIADELNAMPINAVPGANESSPGIEALALVLRSEAIIVGAYIFLALAIFCELSALISFFFWGQSRAERAYVTNVHNVYDMDGNDIHSEMIERNNEVLVQIAQNLDMLLKQQQKIASTHNVLSEPTEKSVSEATESPPKPIETSDKGHSTHNVLSDSENDSESSEKPIDSTHNVLSPIFEKVEVDIQDGKMTNPSFKNLQKMYKITQAQASNIRDMLLKARLVVKDPTGKLLPIPKERT